MNKNNNIYIINSNLSVIANQRIQQFIIGEYNFRYYNPVFNLRTSYDYELNYEGIIYTDIFNKENLIQRLIRKLK